MHYSGKPMKFEDCVLHANTNANANDCGTGSELFIVEGDSASGAVVNVRDTQTQAVLPMQGKPLNALRANGERVAEFSLYKQLTEALGITLTDMDTGEVSDLSNARFDRVLLLFDPDADGIHCGALMLMFLYRWMRPLLESGRVLMVRAPLFVISFAGSEQTFHAYSPDHAGKIMTELKRRGATDIKTHHHRGLASIDTKLLASACVHPSTRRVDVMTVKDAEDAISVFAAER
jgi:DNA gyrase subunit B